MEVCRPYIIFLTESQEQDLQQHFKINSWKITVFKCIHGDLQFLVDMLIQGEELDIPSLKDNVLDSKRRSSRRSKLKSYGLKLDRQKHATSHLSYKQDEKKINKNEENTERNMKKQQLEGDIGKDTVTDTSEDENLLEEAKSLEPLLEDDMEEKTVEANCQSNFDDKDDTSKCEVKMSQVLAYSVPYRNRKHKYKKHVSKGAKIPHFSCEICGKVAASERYLLRHMEKLHSEEAKKRKEEEKRRKQDEEINVCHIQYSSRGMYFFRVSSAELGRKIAEKLRKTP